MVDARVAPLFVGVNDGLGVGARAVAMAGGFELRPDVGVVVDLAVEDDPDRAVLVRHRLMAGRQIDDAQPPVAERRPIVDEFTGVVWPAMRDDVAHPRHP